MREKQQRSMPAPTTAPSRQMGNSAAKRRGRPLPRPGGGSGYGPPHERHEGVGWPVNTTAQRHDANDRLRMMSESWEDAVTRARLHEEHEATQREAAAAADQAARSLRADQVREAAGQIGALAWGFREALLALRPPSSRDAEVWRDATIWHYKKPLLGRRSRSVPLVIVPDAALVWHNTNGHEPYWSWPTNLIIGEEIAPVISSWSYGDKIH